jgi:hypothetical protein
MKNPKRIGRGEAAAISGKSMGPEEFFNQMVEALGITIDRRPKGSP